MHREQGQHFSVPCRLYRYRSWLSWQAATKFASYTTPQCSVNLNQKRSHIQQTVVISPSCLGTFTKPSTSSANPPWQEYIVFRTSYWRCHITVDFATAASQNDVWIIKQMCHILILFQDSLMTENERNKNSVIFWIILVFKLRGIF